MKLNVIELILIRIEITRNITWNWYYCRNSICPNQRSTSKKWLKPLLLDMTAVTARVAGHRLNISIFNITNNDNMANIANINIANIANIATIAPNINVYLYGIAFCRILPCNQKCLKHLVDSSVLTRFGHPQSLCDQYAYFYINYICSALVVAQKGILYTSHSDRIKTM